MPSGADRFRNPKLFRMLFENLVFQLGGYDLPVVVSLRRFRPLNDEAVATSPKMK